MRLRGQTQFLAALALVLFTVMPSFAANLTGTVLNMTSKTGRVYVGLAGWPSGLGVTITAPGSFTIRGVADGYYQLQAFMDSNDDGVFNATEAAGMSTVMVSGGQPMSAPVVQLFDPIVPGTPQPAQSLTASPGNGGALLLWEYPKNMYGAIEAESFDVEWSSDGFATVAGSLLARPLLNTISASGGRCFVTGLLNGETYSFRVKSRIGSQVAASQPVSAVIGAPAGGHTVSGTIALNGFGPIAKPIYIGLWSDNDNKFNFARYQSASNGMSFSIAGVPDGLRGFYGFVDMNQNNVPDFGDYFVSQEVIINVNGANYGGLTVPMNAEDVTLVNVSNMHYPQGDSSQKRMLWLSAKGFRKRPVNCSVTGPQVGTRDVNPLDDIGSTLASRPNVGDSYTFNFTFSDGSTRSYTKAISAVYDNPPTSLAPSGAIAGSPATISWLRPSGFPTNGYVVAGISGNNYQWDSKEYFSSVTSIPYDGPSLPAAQYQLMVNLCDAQRNCIVGATAFTSGASAVAATPASISVPAADPDGSYTVSWGASATSGVSYQLQEASNATFTLGVRTAYAGTALSTSITGRSQNVTYYYRVRAVKTGYTASGYRTSANGCAVPGTLIATPSSITVPAASSSGSYTVTWGGSATPGVTYELQEATNSGFTTGLRTINAGGVSYAAITGRTPYFTYYYRVRAVRSGYTPSAYRTGAAGCAVPGSAAATPASITVPVADADGSFTVSWGGSATSGSSYQLQEATDSSFTAGVRTAYSGTGLSATITGRSQNFTYFYRVRTVRSGYLPSPYRTGTNGCAVPGTVAGSPAGITVPVADADGSYTVSWGASTSAGVSYQLQEATNSTFSAGTRIAYSGTSLSASITGRSQNVTYYYRVLAMKPGLLNSAYRTGVNGCAVPGTATVAAPAGITVPVTDADGAYAVAWGASATAGVNYILQEATNTLFTTGVRTAYTGTALSFTITGRSQNVTYFYRVLAYKPGMRNSAYRIGANGCAVPGTATVATPVSITVPAADSDGAYTVNWGASATAGVTYILQEATNDSFTAGLRTAYIGTALSVAITGRQLGVAYYYRVLAFKPGLRNSAYRTAGNGCPIGTPFDVYDEVHVFDGAVLSSLFLNHAGAVVPGSVTVQDSVSLAYYVEGADYKLNSAINRVDVLPGGNIMPGTVLLISYRYYA